MPKNLMNDSEFDKFASDYRDIHTQNVQSVSGVDSDFFSEYKIKELSSRKLMSDECVFLDMGCGDGNTAKFVKTYFPSVEYHGVDVSQQSIDIAKCQFSNLDFVSYDGYHLPFEDNTFDIVYMSCVVHHICPQDRLTVFAECRRVLKTHGKLIIFEHNTLNPVTMHVVKDCPFDDDAHFLSSFALRKLLKASDYANMFVKYTIFVPRKGFLKKLVGLEKFLSWCPFGGQYYVVASKL